MSGKKRKFIHLVILALVVDFVPIVVFGQDREIDMTSSDHNTLGYRTSRLPARQQEVEAAPAPAPRVNRSTASETDDDEAAAAPASPHTEISAAESNAAARLHAAEAAARVANAAAAPTGPATAPAATAVVRNTEAPQAAARIPAPPAPKTWT